MAFREEDTNTADTAADSNATVQLQGERNNITIGDVASQRQQYPVLFQGRAGLGLKPESGC